MPVKAKLFRPPASGRRFDRTARQRQKKRALPTNSRAWRAMRAAQLDREPLCRLCRERNVITPASHVDHIDGDSHNNHPDNFQSLCPSCHSRKTVREDGAFGKTKCEG